MAKIKITTTDSKLFADTLSFGSTAPTSTTVTLLAASSLSVAGVGKVVGSSGIDNITLLGAFSASAAKAKFGFSEAISAVPTFTYDTKSLAQSTVDILTGTLVKDTIVLDNSYAASPASPAFGVNLKYTAGSTQLDTLTGTVLNDQITLASTSNIKYNSSNTTNTTLAKADTVTGSSGADKIELGGGDRFWAVKTGGGADTLVGTSGADTITLAATPTSAFIFSQSATTNKDGAGAVALDTVIGSSGADIIKLDSLTTGISYQTGGGIDTLFGTTNADTITLSAAGTLKYNSGSAFEQDTITLSSGDDTLTLLVGADVAITSNGGNDKIIGSSSQDTIALTTAVTTPTATKTTLQPLGGGDIIDLTNAAGPVVISFQSKTDSSTSATTRDSITGFDAGILSFSFKAGVAASTGVAAVIGVLKNNDISSLGTGEVTSKFTGGVITAFSGAATTVPSARFDEDLSVLEIDTDGNGTADMSIELVGITAVVDLGSLVFSIE